MKRIIGSCLALLSITTSAFALSPHDDQMIHNIIEHSTDVWNHHGGHGYADYYSSDADFVNIFGMSFSGKEEIEVRHVNILETMLAGSIIEVTNVKLREAGPDLVIAHVHWAVSGILQPDGTPCDTIRGLFTHVFVKNDERWEITASQNTLMLQM